MLTLETQIVVDVILVVLIVLLGVYLTENITVMGRRRIIHPQLLHVPFFLIMIVLLTPVNVLVVMLLPVINVFRKMSGVKINLVLVLAIIY